MAGDVMTNVPRESTDSAVETLKQALRLEAGDYIVLLEERWSTEETLRAFAEVADELWRQNIRLHSIVVHNVEAVRFVRVEQPETLTVEDGPPKQERHFQIDIAGTVMAWGVDAKDLSRNVLKGLALSPEGRVIVVEIK
jgi:hypothetical protein